MAETQIMERSDISRARDITFGHEMGGGSGATAVPTKWSQGSHGVMERGEVSRSNDITFGHDMGYVTSTCNIAGSDCMC